MLNEGNCPAENIVVYLSPSKEVFFCTDNAMDKISLDIPDELPSRISELLYIVENLDLLMNKPHTSMYSSSLAEMLSKMQKTTQPSPYLNLPSIVGPPPIMTIKLEGDQMRIDLDMNLKHGFQYSVKNEEIFICSYLEKGERTTLEYTSHADNLPTPSKGRLIVIANLMFSWNFKSRRKSIIKTVYLVEKTD